MANLLNFKFGQFANLPATKSAGTVYITTDEQAMYVDLPKSHDTNAEITRVRIGDIIVKDSAKTAQPPFSTGAFYYFVTENALCRWNGETWTQINSVSDVQKDISTLSATLNAEITRSTQKDTAHDNAISQLQTDVGNRVTTSAFAAFQQTNTEAIADAKKAGTDAATAAANAKTAADNAQTTANTAQTNANNRIHKNGSVTMEANLKMGGYGIENVADLTSSSDGKMAANKNYVDAAKQAALDAAEDASDAAAAAQETANDALSKANAAQTTANKGVTDAAAALAKANEKATLDEVKALGYATTTYVDNAKSALLGTNNDAATAKTIYGVAKAAAAADTKAGTAQTTAQTAVTNAAKAQGTADTAAAAASVADGKAVTAQETIDAYTAAHANDYTNGQIDSKFNEAKKAGTDAQTTANTALTNAGTAKAAADAAQGDATQALADAAAAQKTIDDYKAAHNGDYTNTQIDSAVAAAKKAGTDAQTTANSALSTAQAALPKAGGTMNSGAEIKMNGGSITGLADLTDTSAGNSAANKNYVDSAISAGIKANDAMQFMGTLGTNGTIAALPTTAVVYTTSDAVLKTLKPQKGHTFKVSTKGTYAGTAARVGDLFINTGADDSTPNWVHISSGYEDDYLQKLASSTDTIYLTDGLNNIADNAVSSVKFVGATNSNINFAITADNAKTGHTVTASLVWGTF